MVFMENLEQKQGGCLFQIEKLGRTLTELNRLKPLRSSCQK